MDFRTKVSLPKVDWEITPAHRITMIGSCFADHIGSCLEQAKFDIHVNPFGVLYNPRSIAIMCRAMVQENPFSDDCFFESGGLGHSWLNDSSFSRDSISACRLHIEQVCREEGKRLLHLDELFITLGTPRYYELADTGMVVGNCHKQPAKRFVEKQMEVDEVTEVLEEALLVLWSVRPSLRVIFTVSPYRYAKYGFHGNQVGKAVLLLAIERLCVKYVNSCSYFPAYEILLDELRDYRFYAEDMLHPSSSAVSYIWECFGDTYFTADTHAFLKEWDSVCRALSHRALHPETAEYQHFLHKTMLKLDQLKEKYPNLAWTCEYNRLKDLLKL